MNDHKLSKLANLLIHAKFTSQTHFPSNLCKQMSFWWCRIYIKHFRM